jgi:hypothetical protein
VIVAPATNVLLRRARRQNPGGWGRLSGVVAAMTCGDGDSLIAV